jgi:hypothetical protein
MGMFDTIKCYYPLPDERLQKEEFQTKDLENLLNDYTITEDGLLIHHVKEYELVPEEERPYYGTKEWDKNPIVQVLGMFKSKFIYDEHVNYNGDLIFYTFNHKTSNLTEYKASFVDGVLIKLEKFENDQRKSNL